MRFFFAHPVFPSVHARSARVGKGEHESGRDWGQQLVVRGLLRSPTGKLDMRVARIPPIGAWSRYLKGTSAHVALELTHVEPVDQRSGTRKADGVWHFWERPGQRHDALRRVAQPPECRLLFTVHMQHVPGTAAEAVVARAASVSTSARRRIHADFFTAPRLCATNTVEAESM